MVVLYSVEVKLWWKIEVCWSSFGVRLCWFYCTLTCQCGGCVEIGCVEIGCVHARTHSTVPGGDTLL